MSPSKLDLDLDLDVVDLVRLVFLGAAGGVRKYHNNLLA